jgi:hypothetical protein
MAKRLGGVLLGFGVNVAGEFYISYNVRLGDMRARDLPTLTPMLLGIRSCPKSHFLRIRTLEVCATMSRPDE